LRLNFIIAGLKRQSKFNFFNGEVVPRFDKNYHKDRTRQKQKATIYKKVACYDAVRIIS
jgi:hypothetical protein